MKQCIGPECTKTKTVAFGLCMGHYRQMRLGKELTPLKGYRVRPEAPEGYAFCNECELFKPLDQFHKTDKDKPRYQCKDCQTINQRKNYERKRATA